MTEDPFASLATALDRTEHRGLGRTSVAASLAVHPSLIAGASGVGRLRLAADERLISLHITGQRLVAILNHQLVADEVRHPPRCLVRHAQLAHLQDRLALPSARGRGLCGRTGEVGGDAHRGFPQPT